MRMLGEPGIDVIAGVCREVVEDEVRLTVPEPVGFQNSATALTCGVRRRNRTR
jgi:hypothetical protein